MKNRLLVLAVLSVVALLASFSQADEWWKVRMDQFNYEKYRRAVSRVNEHFREIERLTQLLAENSDDERFRKRGYIHFSQITEGQSITFKVDGGQLSQYTILNWGTQNIGFPNLVTQLKGYGYITQREILQLRLENLRLKNAPEPEIKELEESLKSLEDEIRVFTSKTTWVD